MSYAGYAVKQCFNCGAEDNEPNAKFCGNCGAGWNFSVPAVSTPDLPFANGLVSPQGTITTALEGQVTLSRPRIKPPSTIPTFAQVQRKGNDGKELYDELGKILILLARERLFLYMHWLAFIAFNVAGCYIAWKCYAEFLGDEVSKIMIASTPFLFINSMALLMIVPIKGTRREISRLKERLSYVKFKIQYGHLI